MPTITVSPGNQTCCSRVANAVFFQAGEGMMPPRSPAMSMPVGSPKPMRAIESWMRWMPSVFASR